MRRSLHWFATAAIVLVASCSSAEGDDLRLGHANVAGWAIYGGHADAGYDLAAAVAERDLDVVGVAEVCESQLVAATEVLDDGYEYAFQQTVTPDALPWSPPVESGCRYGNGILVRRELGLKDIESVELPSEDFTTAHEWDPEEDRWILCARVGGEVATLVCTTHLTNLQPLRDSRLRQVKALSDVVGRSRAGSEPAILLGDFNARVGDGDLAPIAAWVDASRNGGVIHVFVQGLSPADRGKIEVGRTDHDLVWASVRLPSR